MSPPSGLAETVGGITLYNLETAPESNLASS